MSFDEFPEIEILPEGANQNQSVLYQMSHKTPDRSFSKIVTPSPNKSFSNNKPEIKRRLFQNRLSPFKDEFEEDKNEILDQQQPPGPTMELQTLDFQQQPQILELEDDYQQKKKIIIDEFQQEKRLLPKERATKQVSCNLQSTLRGYSVYKDFNCMLNLTDISYGVKGHNKFYQIQVLVQNDLFYFFTRWGRVGAKNPQEKLQQMDSRYDAIKAFKNKFADKTHQEWDNRESFTPQPGKYSMISISTNETNPNSINNEVERVNRRNELIASKMQSIKTQLSEPVYQIMSQIFDMNKMQKTLKQLNFDTEKNPLGRLTHEQINKGLKILSEIQRVLRSDQYKETALLELSNLFYTNIPQNYGMRQLPMIDSLAIVKEKLDLLNVLREIDIANNYFNLAVKEQTNENPIDIFYRMLKTDLVKLEDAEMWGKIVSCVKNTHGPTHDKFKLEVREILEVKRQGEDVRSFPFRKFNNRSILLSQQINKKELLWHGSRTSNYVGILSEGLRIAPPEAPSSGYMFGKGIYFADVCSKSAQYCHPNYDNPEGILLLCEVALGNMYQVYKQKDFFQPPLHFHSVFAVGRNYCDPSKQTFINECSLDLGEVIANLELKKQSIESDLIYNEYVVYDVAQVKIKYLVKVKFMM